MDKSIFTDIRDALIDTGVTGKVYIWNNDILQGLDTLAAFPIVLLQFSNMVFQNLGRNVQECNTATITVHILWKAINSDDTEIFDISQTIYQKMKQSGYSRLSETPEYNGTEIIDWQMVFSIPAFVDKTAAKTYQKYVKPPVEIVK